MHFLVAAKRKEQRFIIAHQRKRKLNGMLHSIALHSASRQCELLFRIVPGQCNTVGAARPVPRRSPERFPAIAILLSHAERKAF